MTCEIATSTMLCSNPDMKSLLAGVAICCVCLVAITVITVLKG